MNKITMCSLSDCLIKVIDYRGKTPKKLGSDWSEKGFRAISANNVKFDGLTKLDSINCLDEKTYKKWMKDEVQSGDLLLTSEAPAGQVMLWLSDEKIVLSQRLFAIRTKENVDNKFLKYYLQSSIGQNEINKNTSGSTVFGISAKMFDLIQVLLPNYTSQVLIGNLLYKLDAKIELNNRINAELEVMAKTLYDYWFVQFDFPDENGKPYKSSGGKMIWNNELKREIPDGWEVKKLGKVFQTSLGGTPSTGNKSYWKDGTINWLNSGEIANFPIINSELKITETAVRNSPTSLLPKGTALLSITRHLRPTVLAIDACVNQSVVGIKEKGDLKYFFIYPYLKNEIPRLMTLRTGAQQPHINKDIVDDSLICIPNADSNILKSYNLKVGSIYEQIMNTALQNQKLAELRDWLLPMLMNGQVTIKEISKSLEFEKPLPNFAETNAGKAKQRETYQQIQVLYTTIWANKEINVRQGEMATAKDVYLLDRIYKVPTNFNFANHNWGAFDPKEKQLLNTKQYFHKPNFPNSQAYYLDLKDDDKLLESISAELKERITSGINEMNDKVFKRYFGKEKARMKELYATVLKCIEDSGSLLLTEIRNKMALWKIKQDGIEITKAKKFSEEETNDALNTIVFENWHRNILPKTN